MTEHPSSKLAPEKRARLFRLASEEFAVQGFTHASLNRIISQMGMSKSSFYHFFENKTDLFRQTIDHTIAPFLEAMEGFDITVLTAETFWPFLSGATREQTRMASQSPDLATMGRMFYRSLDNPDERALTADLLDLSTRWMAELIGHGQGLGLVRTDLPDDLLIETVMGMAMAMERWMLERWDTFSEDEKTALGDAAFDLFVRVLQPVS